MSTSTIAGKSSMRRSVRMLLSLSLLALAVFGLVVAISDIEMVYWVPKNGPGDVIVHVKGKASFRPAVTSSVFAGIIALTAAAWACLAVLRSRPRAQWLIVAWLVIVELVVVYVVYSLPRPMG